MVGNKDIVRNKDHVHQTTVVRVGAEADPGATGTTLTQRWHTHDGHHAYHARIAIKEKTPQQFHSFTVVGGFTGAEKMWVPIAVYSWLKIDYWKFEPNGSVRYPGFETLLLHLEPHEELRLRHSTRHAIIPAAALPASPRALCMSNPSYSSLSLWDVRCSPSRAPVTMVSRR